MGLSQCDVTSNLPLPVMYVQSLSEQVGGCGYRSLFGGADDRTGGCDIRFVSLTDPLECVFVLEFDGFVESQVARS